MKKSKLALRFLRNIACASGVLTLGVYDGVWAPGLVEATETDQRVGLDQIRFVRVGGGYATISQVEIDDIPTKLQSAAGVTDALNRRGVVLIGNVKPAGIFSFDIKELGKGDRVSGIERRDIVDSVFNIYRAYWKKVVGFTGTEYSGAQQVFEVDAQYSLEKKLLKSLMKNESVKNADSEDLMPLLFLARSQGRGYRATFSVVSAGSIDTIKNMLGGDYEELHDVHIVASQDFRRGLGAREAVAELDVDVRRADLPSVVLDDHEENDNRREKQKIFVVEKAVTVGDAAEMIGAMSAEAAAADDLVSLAKLYAKKDRIEQDTNVNPLRQAVVTGITSANTATLKSLIADIPDTSCFADPNKKVPMIKLLAWLTPLDESADYAGKTELAESFTKPETSAVTVQALTHSLADLLKRLVENETLSDYKCENWNGGTTESVEEKYFQAMLDALNLFENYCDYIENKYALDYYLTERHAVIATKMKKDRKSAAGNINTKINSLDFDEKTLPDDLVISGKAAEVLSKKKISSKKLNAVLKKLDKGAIDACAELTGTTYDSDAIATTKLLDELNAEGSKYGVVYFGNIENVKTLLELHIGLLEIDGGVERKFRDKLETLVTIISNAVNITPADGNTYTEDEELKAKQYVSAAMTCVKKLQTTTDDDHLQPFIKLYEADLAAWITKLETKLEEITIPNDPSTAAVKTAKEQETAKLKKLEEDIDDATVNPYMPKIANSGMSVETVKSEISGMRTKLSTAKTEKDIEDIGVEALLTRVNNELETLANYPADTKAKVDELLSTEPDILAKLRDDASYKQIETGDTREKIDSLASETGKTAIGLLVASCRECYEENFAEGRKFAEKANDVRVVKAKTAVSEPDPVGIEDVMIKLKALVDAKKGMESLLAELTLDPDDARITQKALTESYIKQLNYLRNQIDANQLIDVTDKNDLIDNIEAIEKQIKEAEKLSDLPGQNDIENLREKIGDVTTTARRYPEEAANTVLKIFEDDENLKVCTEIQDTPEYQNVTTSGSRADIDNTLLGLLTKKAEKKIKQDYERNYQAAKDIYDQFGDTDGEKYSSASGGTELQRLSEIMDLAEPDTLQAWAERNVALVKAKIALNQVTERLDKEKELQLAANEGRMKEVVRGYTGLRAKLDEALPADTRSDDIMQGVQALEEAKRSIDAAIQTNSNLLNYETLIEAYRKEVRNIETMIQEHSGTGRAHDQAELEREARVRVDTNTNTLREELQALAERMKEGRDLEGVAADDDYRAIIEIASEATSKLADDSLVNKTWQTLDEELNGTRIALDALIKIYEERKRTIDLQQLVNRTIVDLNTHVKEQISEFDKLMDETKSAESQIKDTTQKNDFDERIRNLEAYRAVYDTALTNATDEPNYDSLRSLEQMVAIDSNSLMTLKTDIEKQLNIDILEAKNAEIAKITEEKLENMSDDEQKAKFQELEKAKAEKQEAEKLLVREQNKNTAYNDEIKRLKIEVEDVRRSLKDESARKQTLEKLQHSQGVELDQQRAKLKKLEANTTHEKLKNLPEMPALPEEFVIENGKKPAQPDKFDESTLTERDTKTTQMLKTLLAAVNRAVDIKDFEAFLNGLKILPKAYQYIIASSVATRLNWDAGWKCLAKLNVTDASVDLLLKTETTSEKKMDDFINGILAEIERTGEDGTCAAILRTVTLNLLNRPLFANMALDDRVIEVYGDVLTWNNKVLAVFDKNSDSIRMFNSGSGKRAFEKKETYSYGKGDSKIERLSLLQLLEHALANR